ncbi:MAG: endonuclease III [Chlorobi bacterium]|nr:endonuclease III [Chlorobiota bacterium]
MTSEKEKKRALRIYEILREKYGEQKPALNFSNPFELLIATILSAQCTDARVNVVTEKLFKKYKNPKDFLKTETEELEKDIFSTGFYRQKAKSIKACCEILAKEYDGKVPSNFEELTKLPGVGRKTASVVAGNAFGIPAVAVDTHVRRLSNLLGLADTKNPDKIEAALKELLPERTWIEISHLLASHGRAVCKARKPDCFNCVIYDYCPGKKLK